MKLGEGKSMRSTFIAAVLFAGVSMWLVSPGTGKAQDPRFQPAEVVSAGNLTIPYRSMANGTAVLNLLVSADGEVTGVVVSRDESSITEVAVPSVREWRFRPARLDGRPIASWVTVAVTFNPISLFSGRITLPPLDQQDAAGLLPDFRPPEVTGAAFAANPPLAVNPGTVMLEAALDAAGHVQGTKVVRDAPPFTASATQALADWKFTSATLNGRPVDSHVILVFCFRPTLQAS
jgi:Gram-negative bacterial TonB protein C-terminal